MSSTVLSGISVELDERGFFADPAVWTEDMVPALAAREGIEQLTDEHWAVIRFMRSRYVGREHPPTCRIVSRHCGVPVKELFEMFPKRPIKVVARIAGVPEPLMYLGGCGINWRAGWR